jgi:hypothetical protein
MSKKKITSHQAVYGTYTGQRYLTLHSEVIDHPAFLDLSANAQALLLRVGMEWAKTRHKFGDQNGKFQMATSRVQQFLNLSEYLAIKALHELIEHGFLEIIQLEDWTRRQARQYRLTWLPCGNSLPGKDWKKWKKGRSVFEVPKHKNRMRKNKTTTPLFRVV